MPKRLIITGNFLYMPIVLFKLKPICMCKLIFLINIFLISTVVNGQSGPVNLFIKDNNIIWKKDFTSDKEISEVFDAVIISGIVKDAKMHNNIIYGELRDFYFDYENYSQKLSLIDRSWLSAKYTGYVTLQLQGKKITTTIKKISVYASTDDVALFLTPLERWAVKKDNDAVFSKAFNASVLSIMNNEFERRIKEMLYNQ